MQQLSNWKSFRNYLKEKSVFCENSLSVVGQLIQIQISNARIFVEIWKLYDLSTMLPVHLQLQVDNSRIY